MESLDTFKRYYDYMIQELPYNWLQAGIFLDRMTLTNISNNIKAIDSYLETIVDESIEFVHLLDKEIRRRKVKDKDVGGIILSFKRTIGKIEKFRVQISGLIPLLKKKEMEILGERKKIEDEKNFKEAKQKLKDDYTKLDYLLEKEQLEDDLRELEKVFTSQRIKEKIEIELLADKLRRFSRVILFHTGVSFQTFDKTSLIAQIDLYVKDLEELSRKITDKTLLLDVRGEIQIWRNVRMNLKKTTSDNYQQMKRQLLKLLSDDKGLLDKAEAV